MLRNYIYLVITHFAQSLSFQMESSFIALGYYSRVGHQRAYNKQQSMSKRRTNQKSMGRMFTLLELAVGRLLSTRTVAAGTQMVSFSCPGGAAAGAPFSSSLSSLTSYSSCGVGSGAGVVGPGVVFGRCTTWTLSRRIGPRRWTHGRATREQTVRKRQPMRGIQTR